MKKDKKFLEFINKKASKKFRLFRTKCLYYKLKLKYGKTDRLNVSNGNKKLISNDETRFIVWNLPAVKTCPFRTPHCEENCYARKAEQAYPNCLPSRMKNLEMSKREDFAELMTFTILDIVFNDRKNRKYIVRIHESGDFYNREYAMKWLKVVENCTSERVTFICYTKSFPYFDGLKLHKQFKLRASIWDDTPEWALEMIAKNDWNTYSAVEKFAKGDQFYRCRCKDCATCGWCWSKRKDIRCEIH